MSFLPRIAKFLLAILLSLLTLVLASWLRGQGLPGWGAVSGGLVIFVSTFAFPLLKRYTLPTWGIGFNLMGVLTLWIVMWVVPDTLSIEPVLLGWLLAWWLGTGYGIPAWSIAHRAILLGIVMLGIDAIVQPNWVRYRQQSEVLPLVGNIDFPLLDETGKIVPWDTFAQQTLVIDCWSITCGACIKQFPRLEQFYQAHRQNPQVTVISLNVLSPNEAKTGLGMQQQVASAERHAAPYAFPVYFAGPDAWDRLALTQVPTTIIIDPDGNVRYKGSLEFGWNIWVNRLEAYLGG
ncbi:MAG: hypothetical protein OHK0039_43880 [Bacteroidia bacterium]